MFHLSKWSGKKDINIYFFTFFRKKHEIYQKWGYFINDKVKKLFCHAFFPVAGIWETFMNINGWDVIENYLRRRNRTQQELAAVLKLSGAAITQFKQGTIKLKPQQMERIIEYLGFSENDISLFYTRIFNARLGRRVKRNFHISMSGQSTEHHHYIPLICEEELIHFVPALESISDFASRTARRSYFVEPRLNASFVIHSGRLLIFVDGRANPEDGELAVAMKDSGKIILGYLQNRGGCVLLDGGEFGGGNCRWNCVWTPCEYRFVRPVRKIKFVLYKTAIRRSNLPEEGRKHQ